MKLFRFRHFAKSIFPPFGSNEAEPDLSVDPSYSTLQAHAPESSEELFSEESDGFPAPSRRQRVLSDYSYLVTLQESQPDPVVQEEDAADGDSNFPEAGCSTQPNILYECVTIQILIQ